jgi:hypothetical protein
MTVGWMTLSMTAKVRRSPAEIAAGVGVGTMRPAVGESESMSNVSSMVSRSPVQLMIARSLDAEILVSSGPTTAPQPHAFAGPTAEVARSASVTKPPARTRRMHLILPEARHRTVRA